MKKLWDLMDMDLYREMLLNRYIRVNEKNGFRILTYTEKAQFENEWNAVTRQCRGLIIDKYWNVVARPFDKFMNYGQNRADKLLMDYRVEVTDKMDGSLGILFGKDPNRGSADNVNVSGWSNAVHYYPNWTVATKGSFDSEQAEKMREILREKYSGIRLDTDWTYMFEIVYPGNRIVLDYGDTEDLFLLGARHNETGYVRPAEDVSEWCGPKTLTFSYKTLREALEAPDRANAEGFVVYFPDLDYRMKIKQDDYVALHRTVTNLTPRRIWENMKNGKTLEEIAELVPDEWHEWLDNTYRSIWSVTQAAYKLVTDDYNFVMSQVPKDHSRKDLSFTLDILGIDKKVFFALYEGRDIMPLMWEVSYPNAE